MTCARKSRHGPPPHSRRIDGHFYATATPYAIEHFAHAAIAALFSTRRLRASIFAAPFLRFLERARLIARSERRVSFAILLAGKKASRGAATTPERGHVSNTA